VDLKAKFENSGMTREWNAPKPILEFSPKSAAGLKKLYGELLEIKGKHGNMGASAVDISLVENPGALALLVRLNGLPDKKLCSKGCSCHYTKTTYYGFQGSVIAADIYRFLREDWLECKGPEKCNVSGPSLRRPMLCPQGIIEIGNGGWETNPECYLNSLPSCKNPLVKSIAEKLYQASREN